TRRSRRSPTIRAATCGSTSPATSSPSKWGSEPVASGRSASDRAAAEAEQGADRERDQEHDEQHLGDSGRGRRDAAEAEETGDDRQNQEAERVIEHEFPPSLSGGVANGVPATQAVSVVARLVGLGARRGARWQRDPGRALPHRLARVLLG